MSSSAASATDDAKRQRIDDGSADAVVDGKDFPSMPAVELSDLLAFAEKLARDAGKLKNNVHCDHCVAQRLISSPPFASRCIGASCFRFSCHRGRCL